MPASPAITSSRSVVAPPPPVDCGPMRQDHPVLAYACDALVRTQTARPPVAPPVRPEAPVRRQDLEPARATFKLDARFVPMAMFGVGGPGLGLFLLHTGKLVPGLLAIGMGVLVASSIARSMAAEQR